MYGYHGRVLVVDLNTESYRWDIVPEKILRQYIGGIGLGTYLLYKYCPRKVDPLSGDNPLIFAGSPLVGSRLTTSSKFAVVSKSPLTGFIADSLSSSYLADEIKKSCGDGLVVVGKSDSLTFLHVKNGSVKFLNASHLAGMNTFKTEEEIKRSLGSAVRVASIGPAGENQVLYASIANDGGRQAGRCGLGAVMGSKNIKAVAFQGDMKSPIFDPEGIEILRRDLSLRSLGSATEKYRDVGTVANVALFNRLGVLPTKNFQRSTFDNAERVSGEEFYSNHLNKSAHCANCTIGCEKIMVTNDGGDKKGGRMEYESLFALGPLCNIDDPNIVIRSSRLCDELGMDTISSGVTIAWAMECFEKGILNGDDFEGVSLSFSNSEDFLHILNLIAQRKGIGALLSLGTKRCSEIVGNGSEDWAMHVKGLEMPGYEPRALKTLALGLAITPRGACHNRSSAYEADLSGQVDRFTADQYRGDITATSEDFSAVLDSLIWCKFLRKAFNDFYKESADAYNLVTGWDMTPDELRKCGERINNLKKLFNIREGWSRADDTLPPRILEEQLPDGVMPGIALTSEELSLMIGGYYSARGWTQDGLIPESKLVELNIAY
jgi:aldehyde:ferredoxin oxidoreductase